MNATAATRGSQSAARYNIALMHPFDIRGTKIGGLETYIRDFVTFCPENTRVLFIGVDAVGDMKPGEVAETTFRGRTFDFMPILHYPDVRAREAARRLTDSITARFFLALVRKFPAIAGELRRRRCSVDLRRVEFAWLPFVLRRPYVQMLHGEGVPQMAMDSLLQRYRFVHQSGERFAVSTSRKFLCVNPMITERLRDTYKRHAGKIDTLWTWVNTNIFRPQPFPDATSPFRIVFVGRLDEFKQPRLMFKTIARLRSKLRGAVEFHYVGTSDPTRFAEFAAIEDITVRHGFQDAKGVASVVAQAHAGILTSEFEGMPRCVLETLAIGRPVVAVHLPQLEAVIDDEVSGYLVRREMHDDELVETLTLRLLDVRNAIADGRVDPAVVAGKIATFTPDTQLARVYRLHHEIQRGDAPTAGERLVQSIG
jgi:glycosyltransferase involved in cell wall biosynthesis